MKKYLTKNNLAIAVALAAAALAHARGCVERMPDDVSAPAPAAAAPAPTADAGVAQ